MTDRAQVLLAALLVVSCANKTPDEPGTANSSEGSQTGSPTTGSTSSGASSSTMGAGTGGGIPPGGWNPCGECEEGRFCLVLPGGPECAGTLCQDIDAACESCFADPGSCDMQAHYLCFDTVCHFAHLFKSVEVAADGTIVVFCEEYTETDCTL